MSGPAGWAPLVGPARQENETLRQTGYDTLVPTLGQSLSAHLGNWWQDSPLVALMRIREQNLARDPNLGGSPEEIAQTPPSRPISADEWKGSSYVRPGLSYFDGMNEDTAKLLADRHDERARREDIVNRESTSRYLLMGTVGALSTFADPLNVAASFVPVVGEARYARLLAQLGAPLARGVKGAVEGAVGQAMLEPLNYISDNQDQISHSMVDSLISIGMGAGQGHLLHVGGGWIADLFRRNGGRATAAAGDVAIRQASAGQEVDVRPVVKAAIEEARSNGLIDSVAKSPNRLAAEGETGASSISPSVGRDTLAADREKIRQGQADDAARLPKPQTFDEQRKQAMADLIDAYPSREIALPTGGKVTRKGPMDIVTWLRAMGGVEDAGGELRAIDAKSYNKSREVAFAKGENFLGKLIRDQGDGGMPLEEAARRAAEAGYIGRTEMQTNEHGESGAYSHGTTEELVAAIEKTLGAGDSIEGRVWGIDDDGPVQQYAQTNRAIDQNELFEPEPMREQWQPLTDEDKAAQELAGFDPRDLEGMDNDNLADELWKEEMEREAAAKAQPPEDPQAEAKPTPEGQPKPLTPEQEVELDAERYRTGIAAAAACMARTL